MIFPNWLCLSRTARRRRDSENRRLKQRPSVESLEGRIVPSTFWVSNRNDSGAGSLRQAVIGANSHPGADVIAFRYSAEGTIALTSGELSITGNLRIDGPGDDDLTVSGSGTSRVFNVAAGVNVRIDDLKIARGFVQDANGGAILNAGTLTLNESVVSGSKAARLTAGGLGGGIENTGTLTLNRSKVTDNDASAGGGLHNATGSTATIDDSRISDNTCVGDGAGIRNEISTTVTIDDSLISGNSASGFGTGGIASGGTLNIRDTTISGNTSAAAGMYLFGAGDVSIGRSRIVHNGTAASSVGGIWSTSRGALRIADSTISFNAGHSFAAGIYTNDQSNTRTVEIVRSIVSHNTGGSTGGIFTFDAMAITDSTISDNTADLEDTFSAGAINNQGEGLVITRSTISGNTGNRVGGIGSFGNVSLIRSTINGNTAIPTGNAGVGGISTGYETVLQNSTISGNTVFAAGITQGPYDLYSAAAGGVMAQTSGTTIENSTIAFNRVIDAPLQASQVSGAVTGLNFSFYYAGTTYSFVADVNVRNSIIASNRANGHDPDVTGSFQSQGRNLIGVLNDNATGFVASDLRGSTVSPLNPGLESLRFNGGPTKTHALLRNSPAVNAGDNADAPPTDQRGRDRIVGGTIDIGAYESNFHPLRHDWKVDAAKGDDSPARDQQIEPRYESPKWIFGDLSVESAGTLFGDDGRIDISDFGQFSVRYFSSLP